MLKFLMLVFMVRCSSQGMSEILKMCPGYKGPCPKYAKKCPEKPGLCPEKNGQDSRMTSKVFNDRSDRKSNC